MIPLSLTLTDYDEEHSGLKIETTIGKSTWFLAIWHLLEDNSVLINTFRSFKWSIVTAPEGISWPTCDNPLVLATLLPNGKNICVTKVNQANVLLFPISPTKLIMTCPHAKIPSRYVASEKEGQLFKELIVRNSFLYIYSATEDSEIENLCPHTVDAEEANRIKKEMDSWYDVYKEQEVPYLNKRYHIVDHRTKK